MSKNPTLWFIAALLGIIAILAVDIHMKNKVIAALKKEVMMQQLEIKIHEAANELGL